MDNHGADALVITCIDFRLQEAINNWISQNFAPKTFDRVALAVETYYLHLDGTFEPIL